MNSLRNRAMNGIKWTTMQTISMALCTPVLQIIQARLLNAREFASLAIVMMFISVFNTISSFGISQAIIQRDSISNKEASSLLFFNIIFSLLTGGAVYFLAPALSAYFSLPELIVSLRYVAMYAIVNGPVQLFVALLQKELLFKELALVEIIKNLLIVIVSSVLLFLNYGVNGVIFAMILSVLVGSTVIIYICLKKRLISLLFHFSIKEIHVFLSFGLYVSGKQVLTVIAERLDIIIVGRFLSPEILGVYYFGKNLLEKLRELITASFTGIVFPMLSKIKNNPELLTVTYNKMSKYIAVLAFPVFIGIAVTAHLFVPLIFGDEWKPSVIVFQIVSLSLIFKLLTANMATSLLYSVNKPKVVFYIEIVTNFIYFATLYCVISKGLTAIVVSYSLFVIYKTISLQYFASKMLSAKKIKVGFLKNILISSLLMVFMVIVFQKIASGFTSLILLLGSILIGMLSYITMEWFLERNIVLEIKSYMLLIFLKNRGLMYEKNQKC